MRRTLTVMGATFVIAALAFFLYEVLRRDRLGEFPIDYLGLYLHGLLLVAIGLLLAVFIRSMIAGGRASTAIGAVVLGLTSLLLVVAPFISGDPEQAGDALKPLGAGWYPERFSTLPELFALGMAGLGLSVGLWVAGSLLSRRSTRESAD